MDDHTNLRRSRKPIFQGYVRRILNHGTIVSIDVGQGRRQCEVLMDLAPYREQCEEEGTPLIGEKVTVLVDRCGFWWLRRDEIDA